MSNRKYTKAKMHSIKRVVILALLALVATNLFCYNSGDYRTKWSGNFEDLSLWECYNGLGWINATQLPSSPFANTLYINTQNIAMNTSMIIEGGLVITGTLQLYSGIEVTINKDANCEIGAIQIYSASKLINNSEIKTAYANSSIIVMDGGTLENNGLISASNASQSCQVTVNSNGKITFGSQGSLTGNCSFTANYASSIATSNPQGIDGSLSCSGTISYNSPYFIFNGSEPQITGIKLPEQVLGIDFNNPAGISLSKNIKLVNTALVHSGTTLSFGMFVIDEAWYGSGTFSMEDSSSIATANPDGFSSTGKTGSVQVGTRNYNSNGNYIFNGTVHQQTGNFNPTPTSYTVNDIIFDWHSHIFLPEPYFHLVLVDTFC